MATPLGLSRVEMSFKLPQEYQMHVYICRRWAQDVDDYMGALIVAAHDDAEAMDTFLKYETRDPLGLEIMLGVFATGEPRVLYDDWLR